MRIVDWFRNLFSIKEKSVKKRSLTDLEYNELRSQKQKKLDKILDKISKTGYDSLSNHEKNFLNNF